MKFFALLTLSLVGTSVAAPLNVRATEPKALAAKPTPSSAGGATRARPNAAKSSKTGTPKTPPAPAPPAPDAATPDATTPDATTPDAATPNASTPGTAASSSGKPKPNAPASGANGTSTQINQTGGLITAPDLQTGGNPSSPAVQYAAGAFANDATTVSGSLKALGSETDPEMIRALATVAFSAESDEDKQRAVLSTAGGKLASPGNALILQYTPTVLDGLEAIMNNPTPENAKANVAVIEKARNKNILPSITEITNAAMTKTNLQALAIEFPPTKGSTGGK